MSEAITPLEAVEMNESYQELMEVIIHCLSCLEMEVIDFNDPINDNNYTVGRDFSELELSVALNEFRAKGWQIEKIKNNIYQFTVAPIATVPSNNVAVAPLSPDGVAKKTDSDQMAEVITIVNGQLRHKTFNRIPNVLLKNFSESVVKQAMDQFELVGWSIASSPRDQECLYLQKI